MKHWVAGLVLLMVMTISGLTPEPAHASGQPVMVVGILIDGPHGYVLEANGQTYRLQGFMPDELLGRKVQVTGQLEKDAEGTLWLTVDDYNDQRKQ